VRWRLLVFLGCLLVGVLCAVAVAARGPILEVRWELVVWLAPWALAWAGGVVLAIRLPRRVALPAILLGALALRLAALAGPPTLSDDLFRYAWDGHVQTVGVDAYRYASTDPALARLRDPWLWPDPSGCASLDRSPGCTRINRPTVRTIYPPLAQAWFSGVYRWTGANARHKAWQGAGLVTELAVLALLPFALRAWGKDERWTALYALSPAPIVDIVNNGHVDGLATALVVGALLVAGRRRDRPEWAGALIGAAALVKLYPLVLVAGLAGLGSTARRPPYPPRGAVRRAGAAAATVMAVGHLPHVLAVGPRVLGYLPGYLREERYDQGGRFLLVSLVTGRGRPAVLGATLCVAATVGWVLWRRPPPPHAFAVLLGGLLLVATPVQSWYAVCLLAVATVAAEPAWAIVVAAGYPYFVAVVLAEPHSTLLGRATMGAGLATVVMAAACSRWLRRRDVSAPLEAEPAAAASESSADRKRHPVSRSSPRP
jgi:hypothetical protein